jgi:hypothetical protein
MQWKTFEELKAEGLHSFDAILKKYPGSQFKVGLDILDDPVASPELKAALRTLIREGKAPLMDEAGNPVSVENVVLGDEDAENDTRT